MISMTGFAHKEVEGNVSLSVEIRGYNSRYLEVSVNTPSWLTGIEPNIRDCVSSACNRGKVEVSVRIFEHNIPIKVTVNGDAAKTYKTAIAGLAKELDISEKPSLALLLSLDGVLEVEKNRDNNRYWNIIEPVMREAMESFTASRITEGKYTEQDIMKSLGRIEASLEIVVSHAATMEDTIKNNIKTRFAEILGNSVDENRVLMETAALLVKNTISEEIARLHAHLSEFKAEAARNAQSGKKLDFISQEINREINTIGSKSCILEVSHAVVEMKDALENIREQLRNVE